MIFTLQTYSGSFIDTSIELVGMDNNTFKGRPQYLLDIQKLIALPNEEEEAKA